MYAVIFRAVLNELDDDYFKTAERLRSLAFSKYGCKDFSAVTEGNREIAVSYWQSTEQIKSWKNDEEHIQAQKMGQEKWYKEYTVEIVKIEHAYYNDSQ